MANNVRAFRAALIDAYNGELRPVIEERCRQHIQKDFEAGKIHIGSRLRDWRQVDEWGTTSPSWWRKQCGRYIDWTGDDADLVKLNTEKIDDAARYSADRLIQSMVGKLVEKLMVRADQPVIEVHEITWSGGHKFSLHANIGDIKVEVRQIMIENWTAGGTSYHQHPARIYINNKMIAARDYRKLW